MRRHLVLPHPNQGRLPSMPIHPRLTRITASVSAKSSQSEVTSQPTAMAMMIESVVHMVQSARAVGSRPL